MLYFIIGLAVIAFGIFSFFDSRREIRRALHADAEVVGLQEREVGTDHSRTYYPIVKFLTAAGQEVETETESGGDPPPAMPGDQIKVLYQADNPQKVHIDTFWGRGTLGSSIVTLVGLGLLAYGAHQMIH